MYQYFKQKIKLPKIKQVTDALPVTQKIPNKIRQLLVFVQRNVLSKISDSQYLTINALLSPVLALFIGYFIKYSDTGSTYTFFGNDNIPVYFFMSIVVALFVGLIVSAEEIFHDRKILKREKFLNLSRGSYLLSKVLVLFVISAIQTISFILVGDLVLEIPLGEMRYWLILYSCSCFANMLGLNISSAFDSAVTIYILIPILIIPQLLLSGVVISFDKFNPKVGTPKGVPMMGEFMASRWAFEAYMVTQYKDNQFEKQFYLQDQQMALAEYKRVYYIPELESRLAVVVGERLRWRDSKDTNPIKPALDILRNEIIHELQLVGEDKLPEVNKLVIGKFDSTVYQKTSHFLTTLKKYYSARLTKASEEKESLTQKLTTTPKELANFEAMRLNYQNESVTSMVENSNEATRIVEWRGELIQKIYPIYFNDHRPKNLWDFRGNFYIPTKHFLGKAHDTFYFNVSMIWVMTLILYLTLYFDLLKIGVRRAGIYLKYRKKNLQA